MIACMATDTPRTLAHLKAFSPIATRAKPHVNERSAHQGLYLMPEHDHVPGRVRETNAPPLMRRSGPPPLWTRRSRLTTVRPSAGTGGAAAPAASTVRDH